MTKPPPRHTLNPHAPFVVDTRELAHQPGALHEVTLRDTLPESMGTAMVTLPQGSPVTATLRLESAGDGIWVSGQAVSQSQAECVRCLESFPLPVEVDLQELFLYDTSRDVRRRQHRNEQPAEEEQEELPTLQGTLLDLLPTVRDALVLALPAQPLCDPECPGLCPECGIRLADQPGHAHEDHDPRWSALAALRDDLAQRGETGTLG